MDRDSRQRAYYFMGRIFDENDGGITNCFWFYYYRAPSLKSSRDGVCPKGRLCGSVKDR